MKFLATSLIFKEFNSHHHPSHSRSNFAMIFGIRKLESLGYRAASLA